ncbi:FAD-dependent oxidoreductase [Streptococcus uberis]|nr:FAD-dependent oxidoreductase [Streptococcus uberis]
MAKKILIIGAVAGGATAATRLRRLNEEDQIILFEKGEYISFANCGLPYHIGGSIKERDNLLLQTVEGMSAQYGIDIRNFSEVKSIDKDAKTVTVYDYKRQEEYVESFDELIISTGAKAIKPNIPGFETANNVFTLRNIPDMDLIKAYIAEHHVQTATVIGGGFIGLEMMENLVELGLSVNVIEMAPQVMPSLDFEMAQQLHAQINMHGVNLILNDGLSKIVDQGKLLLLNSGKSLATDMTILSIGVLPENTLAENAGLELGYKGAIKVTPNLQTSAEHIYAIGDVIEVVDTITGKPTNIPLAWPANRQGRIVADVINGIDTAYPGTQGTSVAKIFELTAASTGNSERQLKMNKIEYNAIHIHPNSHAGYYPGASPIALKLLFGKEGQILGAQAVGTEGVEKRIDVIATAIKFGARADQLAAVELAYAPPYSSAKDPVNMLGYVADNMMSGKLETFQWSDIEELKEKKCLLFRCP